MAKYLQNKNGELQEVIATVQSTGAGNAGDIPALDASGKLDPTLLPSGIGADVVGIVASEALNAGDLVNIYSNNGTANVRKAIGTGAGTQAHGYVTAATNSGATASVAFDDSNNQVTGLTPGNQYLSATAAGKSTSVAPSAAGQIVQKVGVATSATTLHVNLQPAITLA